MTNKNFTESKTLNSNVYERLEVAKQGVFLEELKNDTSYIVRTAVAEQGYALDELKNDEHWKVRKAVAEQGYALDELKKDKAPIVVAAAVKAAHDASVKDALLRLENLEKKERAKEKAKQKK